MVSALMDLQAFDARTLGHSLNVCTLGLMIGDQMLRRHGWVDGRGNVRRDGFDDRLEKLGRKMGISSAVEAGPVKLDALFNESKTLLFR